MDMTEVKLNFLNEPEKFNTKFFPSEENPVITICGKGFTKREPNTPARLFIRYNFSSFAYPNLNALFNYYLTRRNHVEDQQSFPSDRALIIVVDNSFDIYDPNGVPLTVEDSISSKDPEKTLSKDLDSIRLPWKDLESHFHIVSVQCKPIHAKNSLEMQSLNRVQLFAQSHESHRHIVSVPYMHNHDENNSRCIWN